MAMKKGDELAKPIGVLVFLLIVAALVVVVRYTVGGPGSTQSKASKSMVLTAGDDVLSLEQDLQALDQNTADEEVRNLDSVE